MEDVDYWNECFYVFVHIFFSSDWHAPLLIDLLNYLSFKY